MAAAPPLVRRLVAGDADLLRSLNRLFGKAFAEPATYSDPSADEIYLESILRREHVIPLVALAESEVIGGLVAYELDKFEAARREVYVYDLAVCEDWRRRGVASALLEYLRSIARTRGAWVIFVQADHGDDPAISLYDKLGSREEVLHFDIPVR